MTAPFLLLICLNMIISLGFSILLRRQTMSAFEQRSKSVWFLKAAHQSDFLNRIIACFQQLPCIRKSKA